MTATSTRPFRRRSTGNLLQQMQQVFLHPVLFFRNLPSIAETRHWLWMAFLIFGLSAYVGVRTELSMFDESATFTLSEQMIMGFNAASPLLLMWFGLLILLAPVVLLRGYAPRWGRNLQIAIWSSSPFALMSIIQLIYMSLGGSPSKGVSAVILELASFNELSAVYQTLVLSLAERFTLYSLWHLVLIYYGARFSLKGQRAVIVLVLLCWIAACVLIPAAWIIQQDAAAFIQP